MNKILYLAGLAVLLSCQRPAESKSDSSPPASPLEKLKAGNERFSQTAPVHPDATVQRKQELTKGQHPFAVVVSCSDSRVPPELIFDQGLGDLFIIRTAGNVIGDYELGSIEYAVEHLHCNLVVVLGHENCGAVGAFLESKGEKHEDHIQNIVDYIGAEEEVKAVLDSAKSDATLAVKANVRHGVAQLKSSAPVLEHLVSSGELNIVGAYYDMDSGKVSFE